MARWAQEILPIVAGAELNEQVIEDLRTIPESARSHRGARSGGLSRGSRSVHAGTARAGIGKAVFTRRVAAAGGAGLLVVLLLGFVQPGFFLSGLTRKFVEGRDQAARAWGPVLSCKSIRRSRSRRSVRVNFQVNGRAMAL